MTVNYSKWDWHGIPTATLLPLHRGYGRLRSCLHGALDDLPSADWRTTSLWRCGANSAARPRSTPTSAATIGPRVAFGLLAGGGLRMGQVIGATDRLGGEPIQRPVKFAELFATLYHTLGLDATQITVPDLAGRPQYFVAGDAAAARIGVAVIGRVYRKVGCVRDAPNQG